MCNKVANFERSVIFWSVGLLQRIGPQKWFIGLNMISLKA